MSLLAKIKDNTIKGVTVKTTVQLSDKEAGAYEELIGIVGEKELLSVALEDPKSLRKKLNSKKKIRVDIDKKLDLTEAQKEEIEKLKTEGFLISEIVAAGLESLQLIKCLKETKATISKDKVSEKEMESEHV